MTLAACLWLGLFPLLQLGTYAHITHDKWLFMLILTGVTLLCFGIDFLLLRRKPGAPEKLPAVPLLLAAGLFLLTVLSCLLGPSGPDVWWIAEKARYEGLAAQLCYFLLFFCFFFSRVSLKPVVFSAAAGVCAFFVIVMLQRSGGNPLGLYPRGTSFALNPEFQGTIGNVDMGTGYLLVLAGLFAYTLLDPLLGRRRVSRALAAAAVPALLLVLYLIITMDVQFGAISLAVLFAATLFRLLPKKYRLPVLVLLVILALLAVWFWPGAGGGIWELHEILHGRSRLSFGSNRVAVWTYSLGLSGERLLLGGGSGTFPGRFNRYLSENGLTIPAEQDGVPLPDYFDNPHNEYIQQLTDHGLPAALLFAALMILCVFRRRDRFLPLLTPWTAPVLCYAVQAFFSFSVCLVAPLFWVVLGASFRASES